MNVPAARGGPEMSFEVHGNAVLHKPGSAEIERALARKHAYRTI